MKRLFLPLVILVLAACASLGLPTPKGFDQQLADAYGVHTAVLQTIAIGTQGGQLSSADANAINNMAVNARVILDAARTAYAAGDKPMANSKLALALSVLTQLQQYLNSHTKGSKP